MLTAELIRQILDLAPDALIIADVQGSIVFASRQVTSLFGYEPEELAGSPVETLMPERFRRRHLAHRSQFAASPRARAMGSTLELFGRRKDGTEFPVEISLGPITEGNRALVVATIRDTTDRQQIQARLRQAIQDTERANEAKSRFLATASHDLRQPVQTLGLLNGALRRVNPNGQTLELLEEAERAVGAMTRLLNALLDISKLESGAVKPQAGDFQVSSLFEELRADFATLAAGKGLRLEIGPCDAVARSDRALVAQAMRNLVSNGIKYTREGGVSLRCVRAGGRVQLRVEDSGVGIPAGEIARICDDFYQVGVDSNVSREGYGLGLSIVSRIAKLLGLKFGIESVAGKGSAFSLDVPASDSAMDAAAAVERPRAPGQPRRHCRTHILLVEDDPGVRNSTRMLLRVEGHAVSTASNLKEAVRLAAEHPDIGMLVSDYHLGSNETGVQVVAAVREAIGPDVKAILVTGDTSSAMRALTHDSNLRTLSKPVNADEMLALVDAMLDPRGA